MSHVFISYSRKDLNFAQKIVNALAANNLETWIDWKIIPKGEAWKMEIHRGIEAAEAFLFLISPDSVASEMCNKEIGDAVNNGKRILPKVLRDTNKREFLDEAAKKEISKRNWIFCRDGQDDFSKAIEEINKAIQTDNEWLRYHTKVLTKAHDWEWHNDYGRLLCGEELREAEEQLAKAESEKDPQPIELQRNYVLASRQTEARQRRQITVSLGVGFVVVAFLAFLAWLQRNEAIRREIFEQLLKQMRSNKLKLPLLASCLLKRSIFI